MHMSTSTTTNMSLTRPDGTHPQHLGAKERAWKVTQQCSRRIRVSSLGPRVCFFIFFIYTLLTVIYRLARMATTIVYGHREHQRGTQH